jgi:hypothetical protein
MSKLLVVALVAFGVMAVPTSTYANGDQPTRFTAHLTGAEEVPAKNVPGTADAQFEVLPGGKAMRFRLRAHDIANVTQAHIHIGPVGANGPVVIFLFNDFDQPATPNGLLAQGVLTEDELTGPFEGAPMSALLAEMRNGNAYVNVHTIANPGGEIRGQVRVVDSNAGDG